MGKRKHRKNKKKTWFLLFVLLFCAALVLIRIGWRQREGEYTVKKIAAGSLDIDLSDEIVKGEIPALYQTDSRWADYMYGTDTMDITGCGPTCLSMVACGLRGDAKWSPPEVADYAQKHGYYVEGSGSKWALMAEGAEKFGLAAKELPLEESIIRNELNNGYPIICIMGEGDFTTSGHYIVLAGENEDGTIQVHDPNSEENSEKSWDLQRLMMQMKNLWGYSCSK